MASSARNPPSRQQGQIAPARRSYCRSYRNLASSFAPPASQGTMRLTPPGMQLETSQIAAAFYSLVSSISRWLSCFSWLANHTVRTRHLIDGVVPRARCHERFNRLERLNAAPGPDRHAIQRSGSAGKIELSFERPALKQPIDKSGVEDISGSGCIDHRNTIGSGMVELLAIPRQHAVVSQRCCREKTSIAKLHLLQRSLQVRLRHEPAGDVWTHNQIVDVLKECVHA